MPAATYKIYVDWDNDGYVAGDDVFFLPPLFLAPTDDDYGDVTSRVRINPGLSTTRGRDQIRALAPPRAGTSDMEVTNQDQRFSPENTASPLYGQLLPGRKLQIRAYYGGTQYTLWTGYLDDLPQHPERNRRTVSLPALGTLSRLAGKNVSSALYSDITTDVALGHLLDAAGWPADMRVIDTGKTLLRWWWLENEDAFSAARALLASEGPGAAMYEDGQGRIVFESRHYRQVTSRSNTSQATFSDTGAEPLMSGTFGYQPGLKDIINACTIEVKTREAQSLAAVWELTQTITFAPGETRYLVVGTSDPFTAAVTPVAVTDYTLSAGSFATVSLSRTSGQSCTITLTAGASGATLTWIRVRAQSVTVTNTVTVTSVVDATASIARYGRQVYSHSVRSEVNINDAQDLADAIVGIYMEPRATVTVTVNNGHADRLTQILTREVSDRITVVEAQTVLDAAFWIEQISHEVSAGGGVHKTTFGCERATNTSYAVWGTSTWGSGLWGF